MSQVSVAVQTPKLASLPEGYIWEAKGSPASMGNKGHLEGAMLVLTELWRRV